MLIIWALVIVLIIAVTVLFWVLIRRQDHIHVDHQVVAKLEHKVEALEINLQKTLEIMQDLAKKMHTQQEVLDRTNQKLNQLELQNTELVNVLTKAVQTKD